MANMLEGHHVRDPHDLHARTEVQLDQAAEEVARRLPDKVDYESVRQVVGAAYERLSRHAKFHNFLPILAARAAQQTLAAEKASDQLHEKFVSVGSPPRRSRPTTAGN